jgi:hypothetical protein
MLNDTQKKFIYIVLTTLSGPALNIVSRKLNMLPDDVIMWTNLLAALTAAVGTAWGLTALSTPHNVDSVSKLPGVQVHVDTSVVAPDVAALATDKVNHVDVVPMGPEGPVHKQ